MVRKKRVVYTRGGAAETPNWTFGLKASIPRHSVPEFCKGLDFIVRERGGGSYFYPDYKNSKMAAAFEWYLPYRGWRFGYKAGVEFWIDQGGLQRIGAYVLYGPDHPQSGQTPAFTQADEAKFQHKIIETLELALSWRTEVESEQFFTVHYVQLPDFRVVRSTIEIPSLSCYLLPTILMGKDASDLETRSLRNSVYMNRLRGKIRENCAQGKYSGTDYGRTTLRGYLQLPSDTFRSPTAAQLGAFNWDYSISGGSVNFTVRNRVSLNSLLYHIPFVPVYPRSRFGPGGNIYQTFNWSEPSPCGP